MPVHGAGRTLVPAPYNESMYSLERLRGGAPATDQKATLDHPMEHLVACHNRIEERLKILERVAASLESKPEEARQALAGCFRYFESSGILHTQDEEQSLFPRLAGRLSEEDAACVRELESQHREADELYEQLKRFPEPGSDPAPWRGVVTRFCEHYRAHIATENNRVFEAARRALSDSELGAIAAEMKRRRGFAE